MSRTDRLGGIGQKKLKVADNLRRIGDEWLVQKAVLIGVLIGTLAFVGYRLLKSGLATTNPRDEIAPMVVALVLGVAGAVLVVLIRANASDRAADRYRQERRIPTVDDW